MLCSSALGRFWRCEYYTTASVRVLGVDAFGPELGEITSVVKNVSGYALEVVALHEDVFRSHLADLMVDYVLERD